MNLNDHIASIWLIFFVGSKPLLKWVMSTSTPLSSDFITHLRWCVYSHLVSLSPRGNTWETQSTVFTPRWVYFENSIIFVHLNRSIWKDVNTSHNVYFILGYTRRCFEYILLDPFHLYNPKCILEEDRYWRSTPGYRQNHRPRRETIC